MLKQVQIENRNGEKMKITINSEERGPLNLITLRIITPKQTKINV